MASISSATSLFSSAPTGATGAGAQGAPNTAAANDASGGDAFLNLVNGMIHGNTSPGQLPSNLVQFLLTGDASTLEGLELETATEGDTTDADDEDSEASGGELALAAILAGMQPVKPPPMPATGSGHSDPDTAIHASGGREALQTLITASQDALASAFDDAASEDAAIDTASGSAQQAQSPNSAAPLHHLMTAHKAAEAAPQAASAEVRTPVGSPGWADEIGTHLTMMAANGREAASLRLSPEHLGPVEVRISMKDGDANIMFTAANADTRSALEQSLPRLREMFASQGLMLGDANVSRDAPRDSFRPATFASASRGSSDADSVADVKSVTLSRVGLVDTYV